MVDRTPSQPTKDVKPDRWAALREQGRDRTPVGGYRDILTIEGRREDLHYRWVLDSNEDGKNIWKFRNGGWQFVMADELDGIGQDMVMKSRNIGTLIRVPANRQGDYLYLMAIPKEWYEENQRQKQQEIDEREKSMFRRRDESEELYGAANRDKSSGKSEGGFAKQIVS